MNILIVNSFYYPNMIGGTEHSVKLLAETLVNEGHNVSVFTIDGIDKKHLTQPELINGVSVYRTYFDTIYKTYISAKTMNIVEKIAVLTSNIYNYKALKDFEKVLNIVKPDVVHTNATIGISNAIWKLCYLKKIKTVSTIRDYRFLNIYSDVKKVNFLLEWLLMKPYRLYCRCLERNYLDSVTTASRFVMERYKKYGYFNKTTNHIVVNSINLDTKKLYESIYEKLERLDTKVKFMYAGNLSEIKGLRILVEAFKKSNNKAIKLVVCGDGILRNYIEEQASIDNRIVFRGKLTKQELDKEYQENDIIVVPSMWEEPFGRIIIEGAQYGMLCIASDRGGIPEIIEQLSVGKSIFPNEENLLNCIEYYSNRNNIKKEICKLRKTLPCYDIGKQVEKFIRIYRVDRKN